MSIVQAEEAFITRVNACHRPSDRKHRVFRAAARVLRTRCALLGLTLAQQERAVKDARDVAELEQRAGE